MATNALAARSVLRPGPIPVARPVVAVVPVAIKFTRSRERVIVSVEEISAPWTRPAGVAADGRPRALNPPAVVDDHPGLGRDISAGVPRSGRAPDTVPGHGEVEVAIGLCLRESPRCGPLTRP